MNDLTTLAHKMMLIPTATIKRNDAEPSYTVRASYPHAGADRVNGMSWTVTRLDVAKRLVVAIEAGAVLTNPTVETDINGSTYISTTGMRVRGRAMNADLTRLGY